MVVQPRVSQIELLPASLAAVHPQKGSSSCGEPFLGLGSELIEGSLTIYIINSGLTLADSLP